MTETWRTIVAAVLDAREAHVTLERAADLAPALRGRRPAGLPYSAWELLAHVRFAQVDLLAYLVEPRYTAPEWPADYGPEAAEPPMALDHEAYHVGQVVLVRRLLGAWPGGSDVS